MTPRLALIALMTLPLAACDGVALPGLPTTAAPAVQGHKGPPGVSPLDQPIETGAEIRPVSTAEPTTYNTAAFSARGNEPFWAVDVAGSTAIYKTPDNQKGRPIRVKRLAFAQGVEYVGVHAGRPFVVNVRAAACKDSMSGDNFPFTARLTVSGRTEAGCAGPATAEVAQAVAAIKAPAPAAPKQAATTTRRPAATRPAAAPAPASAPAPAAATETPARPETPATTTPPASTAPAAPAAPATAPASEGTANLPTPPAAPAADAAAPAPIVPTLPVLPPAATPAPATPTEPAE